MSRPSAGSGRGRATGVAILVFWLVAGLPAQQGSAGNSRTAPQKKVQRGGVLPPLTRKTRLKAYEYALFGWQRMVTAAATAGAQQYLDQPREWPQGLGGYARRYADDWGRNAIQQTVAYGFSAILHEDPRYRARLHGSVAARMWWALKWTLVIRTDSGGEHPNFPLLVGSYASEFVANSWLPRSDNDPESALRRGSYGILGEFAFTLWKEFGPSWRPHVGGKKAPRKAGSKRQRP